MNPDQHFLTRTEADDLFALVKALPSFRTENVQMGQRQGYLRRLSLPSWSQYGTFRGLALGSKNEGAYHQEYKDVKGLLQDSLDSAPREVRNLAIKLSRFAGKPVNYFSLVGYADENDHINPHQHGEDRGRDARVFIVSLGAVRRFYLSPCCDKCRVCPKCNASDCVGHERKCEPCKKAKAYRKKHCQYIPKVKRDSKKYDLQHGSLFALSDEDNFKSYHAILDSKTPKGLRISFNTKCLPTEETLDQFIKRMQGPPVPNTDPKLKEREAMAADLRDGTVTPVNPQAKKLSAELLLEFPNATDLKAKSKKDWRHIKGFIDKKEARALYGQLVDSPDWAPNGDHPTQSFGIYYGKSYDKQTRGKSMQGGRSEGEIPKLPAFLKDLINRIEQEVECPVNYVQCHRYGPDVSVRPHRDPGGTVVPMLTLGQERTFQVGGTATKWAINQADREVEWHVPAETPLMNQGDLLVFDGGQTIHSMYPTTQDPAFKPNKSEWRISIIFRWTTEIMRQYGPGAKGVKGSEYKKAYNSDRKKWRAANIKPRVYCCRAGMAYPPDAVYVGCKTLSQPPREGTPFGNAKNPLVPPSHPDSHHNSPIADSEKDFRAYAVKKMLDSKFRARAIKALRGKHLLCWCIQDGPNRQQFCHARVWLELVNPKHGKVAES